MTSQKSPVGRNTSNLAQRSLCQCANLNIRKPKPHHHDSLHSRRASACAPCAADPGGYPPQILHLPGRTVVASPWLFMAICKPVEQRLSTTRGHSTSTPNQIASMMHTSHILRTVSPKGPYMQTSRHSPKANKLNMGPVAKWSMADTASADIREASFSHHSDSEAQPYMDTCSVFGFPNFKSSCAGLLRLRAKGFDKPWNLYKEPKNQPPDPGPARAAPDLNPSDSIPACPIHKWPIS